MLAIQKQEMFQIVEKEGDLFTRCSPNVSLAHCVSLDFRMSQGIALQFKQKYGRVAALRAQVRQVGGCAVIKDGSRWLFYLVTKPRYFLKPSYHTLELALISLKQHLLELQITELAIPGFMACHRDKLNWYRVKQLLYKVFHNVDITIYIVYFT